MNERITRLLLLASLSGMVLAYYGLPLRGGRAYFGYDTGLLNYTILRDYTQELKNGEFNLWEPSLYGGVYRAANPALGLYSPRLIFYFIFSDYKAQTACILYFFMVAAFGGYLFGSSLARSRPAGLFMGAIYSCSGFMASMIENIPYLSAAWLPWVFWAYIKFRERRGPAWPMVLFLAMTGIEGDIIGCFITYACLWVFFAIDPHEKGARKKEAGTLALAGILTAGMLGIILFPSVEALPETVRGIPLSYKEAALFSLHPLRLLNLLAPSLWGEPVTRSFWGRHLASSLHDPHFWAESIYIGLIPLACAGLALMDRSMRRSIRAPVFLALAMFILSLGKYTPFYGILYSLIPGMDRFRYPAKFYAWVSFFLVWCATAGYGRLTSNDLSARAKKFLTRGAPVFFAAGLTVVLFYVFLNETFKANSPENIDRYFHLLVRDALRLGLAAIIIPAILFFRDRKRLSRNILHFTIMGLAVIDLFFAFPRLYKEPLERINRPSSIARGISSRHENRLLRIGGIEDFSRTSLRENLKPDWGLVEGVDYVFGYTPNVPLRYSRISQDYLLGNFRKLAGIFNIRYILSSVNPAPREIQELYNNGLLRAENIYREANLILCSTTTPGPRFSISRKITWADSKDQALETLAGIDTEAIILEKEEAFHDGNPLRPAPEIKLRSLEEFPMEEKISSHRKSNDEITVNSSLASEGVLIVREGLGPGWKVWVNGKPEVLYRADCFSAAVKVPAREALVRFYFSPPGFKAGALVSAVSLLATLAWILFSARRAGKSSRT